MNMTAHYDVLVIGGGPGGSAAAAFLAQKAKSVLVLEKETFPRFHIGESLLPYNRAIFEELGVLPELERAGFPRKFGAQFHIGNGSRSLPVLFRNGKFTREWSAFQVERAKFDHILLRHAASLGAVVRENWTVTRFVSHPDHILIEARGPDGRIHSFTGSFLVDASGRSNLTGNQENLRVIHPKLKKLALFGHFKNVRLDPGPQGGDTIIVRLENKWFWLIPISEEKTSVGCVMDQAEFAEAREEPAALFARLWQSSLPMRQRMENAELVGRFQTTGDFSYRNQRFVGHRLVRVGDAAGFMDPIFSAGVYLAMHSGKLAAQGIVRALDEGSDGAPFFRAYEKRIQSGMSLYWEMVENFYTTPFLELFFSPKENFQLASAVNAILAGELNGGWRLRWRMRLFFWLIKIQSRRPFVPRISFTETDQMKSTSKTETSSP